MTDLRLHGDALARDGLLDFAVSVWPTEPSPALAAALRAALAGSRRYPDPRPAREAIARRHGRPLDEVVLLNGACEAFWLIAHALRPRLGACVHPAFTEPEAALRAAGVPVIRVARPADDWRLQPHTVHADADLVVLGNPNNPTGNLDHAATVAALARQGRVLVVDESFIELTEHPEHSLADRRDLPGLVVVRSLTKLWGAPACAPATCWPHPTWLQRSSATASPGASTPSPSLRWRPALPIASPRPRSPAPSAPRART
jgi:histidinol-phosphate aminotransferase